MEFKDYYETLGLGRDAKPDEITRAHRRLACKLHPDLNAEPDAEDRFKEVQEAYEVLRDPEKRAAYDRFGADWQAGQEFRPPPDWQPDVDFAGGGYTGAGEFSDFFEALFGAAGHRRSGGGYTHLRMKGEDIHARTVVSLEDSFRGATHGLSLQVPQLDDAGRLTTRSRSLNVTIPKGVVHGQQIRLRGRGLPGTPAGDQYVEIEIQTPKAETDEARALYERMRQEMAFDPRAGLGRS
ncbi:MAG: DnaJ domain-containing protein [Alphaproteobacteria bacterium]|nr:DnaJ domain-containing protein [Alphaproteobacteria bacterium]